MNAPAINQVRDYHALAGKCLSETVLNYLQDGDDGRNEHALSAIRVMPRPLCDVRGGNTRLTLFGQALEHPVLLAPIAYQRLFSPDGESASAMAAAAQGGQLLVSSLASLPIADIVSAAVDTGGHAPWFQLYWQGDRPRTLRLLQCAVSAGCSAMVFTVDAPVKMATLLLPDDVSAANLETPAVRPPAAEGHSSVFAEWMTQAPTWSDLEWLRGETGLPLIIKGVLHPDDAACAVDAGCDGIVVSNHGGRVLHQAPASLDMLPAIIRRIDGRIPVLFDSGIRNGHDVFVALAHGATAVLVGRPYIWGLAANGALGVAQVIRMMRDGLEMTMALTGCTRLADIDLSCCPSGS